MAATVRWSLVTGVTPVLADAISGVQYGEDDVASSVFPVLVPSTTGTAYSRAKVFCLEVTGSDATTISNRRVRLAGALPTGMYAWYRVDTSYAQGVSPADNTTTNGAAPSGYTDLSTSNVVYDGASLAATAGRNGAYVSIVVGISAAYVGSDGSGIALPALIVSYDEL